MKKTSLMFLALVGFLFSCMEEPVQTTMDLRSMDPADWAYCEQPWADCPMCDAPTGPACPEVTDGSGWLCCEGSWAGTDCFPIDGSPDGTCMGDYYYCDFYEQDPGGSALCYDEFGQG